MRTSLEVADVFRAAGPAYRAAHAGHLSLHQLKVMSAIEHCRTAALGGHVEACEDCGQLRIAYNSCRNRHCPKCQAMARAVWLEKRESELLPVPYFHVVFTLPHELGPLALQNKRVVYGILFRAAAQTLLEIAADPKHLGAKIGCLMVLHTWGQNLMHHPHVHAIVTGGGLSADGSRWIHGKQSKRRKPFFAPGKVLSRVFRGKFIDSLKRTFRSGKLGFHGRLKSLGDEAAFEQLLNKSVRHDWVVYAKRPFSSPACVLKYLARYTHRVAISNRRLVELRNGRVSFRYKDYSDDQQSKVLSLSSSEFIRRFLMHTLPSGFVRIRYYGFLANRYRNERLEKCRHLLGVTSVPASTTTAKESQTPVENSDPAPSPKTCPACGRQSLVIIEVVPATRPLPPRHPYFLTDRTVNSNCFDTS